MLSPSLRAAASAWSEMRDLGPPGGNPQNEKKEDAGELQHLLHRLSEKQTDGQQKA
jgi:hypothetical protein